MNRRDFLNSLGAVAVTAIAPRPAFAQRSGARYDRLLVLVELKGGNDGLNTVVPYTDPAYPGVRPRLAVPRDQVLQLDSQAGFHPALEPLMASWKSRELAVVQGVGYADANLSHFRSIDIWDTASNSNEYLTDGWLARAFAAAPAPAAFAADAVVVGGAEMGPLRGGVRAISLANPEQFLRQARYAAPAGQASNAALHHILRVEENIAQAATRLNGNRSFATDFPTHPFGNAVRTAAQLVAGDAGIATIKVALGGFDTHSGQPGRHAQLLKALAEGLVALKAALVELGRWDSTLVMTYSEFGRRPRENLSSGTDHGTASAHFLLGGRVKGG
ncbi:MAG TPA: DUF1501 domain-containing protein, partial [Burkholderiales bacterium]|nr:DUF1501 domain-containing protein [Burkholderiales bacterium]